MAENNPDVGKTFNPSDPMFANVGSINDASTAFGQDVSTAQMKDIIIAQRQAQTKNLFDAGSSNKVVSGSDEARKNADLVKKDATNLAADVDALDTTTTIDDIKKQIGYKDPNAPLTTAEQQQVEAEAAAAGAEYDDLIKTAEDAKKFGLPKAMIGAGERGGFMSTQFAGAAALTQTQGDTFVGAGGELENIKSAYDRNIQKMQAAKVQAIRLARIAAQKAIKTGKREDNEDAANLFKMAQDANMKAVQLVQAKVDLVNSVEKSQQAKVEFGQEQEDRIIENIVPQIESAIEGIEDPTQIQTIINKIATDNNVDVGRVMAYIKEKQQADAQFQADLGTKHFNMSQKLSVGETWTDPATGYTIKGSGDKDIMEVKKTIGGNEYLVHYDMSDPNNPVEMFKMDLGPKYKPTGSGTDGGEEDVLVGVANELNKLKQTGEFNDFYYNRAVEDLAAYYGVEMTEEEAVNQLKTILNNKLAEIEGGVAGGGTIIGDEEEENVASNWVTKELFPGASVPLPTKKATQKAISSQDPFKDLTKLPGQDSGKSSTPKAFK